MPGWDFQRDNASLQVKDTISGDLVEIAYTTGKYCHVNISSVVSTYVSAFSTKLATDINAGPGTLAGYTVSFSQATGKYTIGNGGGNAFTIKGPSGATLAGTAAGLLLGFSTDQSGTNSYISDYRCQHWIETTIGAKSVVSDDYEPPGMVVGAFADGGAHYAIGVSSAIKYGDFDVEFETKAKVFKRSAIASIPYTFEHLFEHARGDQPIAVVDDDETVYYLRPDGGSFKPRRHAIDYDGLWSIPFRCIMEGRF